MGHHNTDDKQLNKWHRPAAKAGAEVAGKEAVPGEAAELAEKACAAEAAPAAGRSAVEKSTAAVAAAAAEAALPTAVAVGGIRC